MLKEAKYGVLEECGLDIIAKQRGIDLDKELIKRKVIDTQKKSIRKKIESEIYDYMFKIPEEMEEE